MRRISPAFRQVDTLTENVRKQRNTTETAQTKMAETKVRLVRVPIGRIVRAKSKRHSLSRTNG